MVCTGGQCGPFALRRTWLTTWHTSSILRARRESLGCGTRSRPLVNLFNPKSRMPGLAPGDRLLAIATISFDIATLDILLPLCSGATLAIANRFAAGDAFELARLLEEHEITFLQATPFTWRLLVNSGWTGKRNLRMVSGGEALPRDLANQLLPLGQELWNCYGPTETTIIRGPFVLREKTGLCPWDRQLRTQAFMSSMKPAGCCLRAYLESCVSAAWA